MRLREKTKVSVWHRLNDYTHIPINLNAIREAKYS
jgi:hypothetical protein